MYTLDNESSRRISARYTRNYVLVTCFVALFSLVYERFSFGVWSGFMVFAFAASLVLGVLPWAVNTALARPISPDPSARQLWNAGIAVLTVGCLFRGILDIYGTTSALGTVYWIVGPVLLLASILASRDRRHCYKSRTIYNSEI